MRTTHFFDNHFLVLARSRNGTKNELGIRGTFENREKAGKIGNEVFLGGQN